MEAVVLNFYTIETEAAIKRQDLERSAAADARAALARHVSPDGSGRGWSVASAKLPALAWPRIPAGAPVGPRQALRPVEC